MGRRWRAREEARGRAFIGPVGPSVVVEFTDHMSEDCFAHRAKPLGITWEQVVKAVRLPNGGRSDREDSDRPGRFFRFVRLDGIAVRGRRFKVVCVAVEPADENSPGRIEVITIIDLHEGGPSDD